MALSSRHCAQAPAERIETDRGYLADLTAHESVEERKLTAAFLSRCGRASDFAASFREFLDRRSAGCRGGGSDQLKRLAASGFVKPCCGSTRTGYCCARGPFRRSPSAS